MTNIILISFAIILIWHILYEKVILSALLVKYKFQLFQLRDQLRQLYIESEKDIDKKEYDYVSENIRYTIKNIEDINIVDYFFIRKELLKDEELLKEVKEVSGFIKKSKNKKLKEIHKKAILNGGIISMLNAGAWAIYLFIPSLLILPLLLIKFSLDLKTPIEDSSEKLIRYELKNKFA